MKGNKMASGIITPALEQRCVIGIFDEGRCHGNPTNPAGRRADAALSQRMVCCWCDMFKKGSDSVRGTYASTSHDGDSGIVFWCMPGVIHVKHMERGKIVNAKYYSDLCLI